MNELVEQYQEAQKRVQEIRDEAQKVAREAFKEGAESLFKEYGDVVASVSWTQYTPYFNDGEPCVFGAHTDYPGICEPGLSVAERDNVVHEESGAFSEYGDESKIREIITKYEMKDNGRGYESYTRVGEEPNSNYSQRHKDAYDAIKAFLKIWDDETLNALFGDHVCVNVTPEGIDVEEYEHE